MGQPQFSQVRPISQERCDGFVFEVPAIVQVDLEDVSAVSCKSDDGSIGELLAAVQFKLVLLASPMNSKIERMLTLFK